MDEVPLAGGNVTAGVVRVGDTVRRPAGPATPAVHALLTHLVDAGVPGVPRPLGVDDRGREVLSFVLGGLADAYGLDETARRRLLAVLDRRPAAMAGHLDVAGGRDGTEPWARLWREGHGRTWSAVAPHIRAHRTAWRRALLG